MRLQALVCVSERERGLQPHPLRLLSFLHMFPALCSSYPCKPWGARHLGRLALVVGFQTKFQLTFSQTSRPDKQLAPRNVPWCHFLEVEVSKNLEVQVVFEIGILQIA